MLIGSLFSGIGGLDLGLQWSGCGTILWQVEKDEFSRRVLQKHWPEVSRYPEIRGLCPEPVDLVCASLPRNAFTCRKSQKTSLWDEFFRVVRETRPRYVVLELYPAIFRGIQSILLGQMASFGFDAWWDSLQASALGAPCRRERVFVLGWQHMAGSVDPKEQCLLVGSDFRVPEGLDGRWPHREFFSVTKIEKERQKVLAEASSPQCAYIAGSIIRMMEDGRENRRST